MRTKAAFGLLPCLGSAGLITLSLIVITLLFINPISFTNSISQKSQQKVSFAPHFIASIDTMKESKDTAANPLTSREITNDVRTSAQLNATYITVDTPYDFPEYMEEWIQAIRAAGKHVWFRSHFNQWENDYGTTGIMTPAAYLSRLDTFIRQHPVFFKPGDLFDACTEPENGNYWATVSHYGHEWTWKNAPNSTTDEYNQFILSLTTTADTALNSLHIFGVDTRVHSTNGYVAQRTMTLYPTTVKIMGRIVTDSYGAQDLTVAPDVAAKSLKIELETIASIRKVPLLIGETGYSTQGPVSSVQQERVIHALINMLRTLPFLQGLNYWVGAGNSNDGTRLFDSQETTSSLRASAYILADFYAEREKSATSKA